MGSAQSLLSPQSAAAAVVVAGAAAYGFAQYGQSPDAASTSAPAASSAADAADSKKKRKKGTKTPLEDSEKGVVAGATAASVVAFPSVIPGGFAGGALDSTAPETESAAAAKPVKGKKKKAKKAAGAGTSLGGGLRVVPADALSDSSATAPESTAAQRPAPSSSRRRSLAKVPQLQLQGEDVDEQWTKVETKKPKLAKEQARPGTERPLEVSTSDIGVTTSSVTGTGNSSPVTERTEDEPEEVESEGQEGTRRKTLAEKLLPKPRKTGVEDMLESPDHPTVARVMRIHPAPGEKPAAGFTWGDYEDVDDTRTADDADGEDDGGWGVVKSRRAKPNRTPSQPSQTQAQPSAESTKKQRQNASKRDAAKATKADAEAERLARLAAHKRELERAKIAEQYGKPGKSVGGGMSAFVDEDGKLVWK